MCGRFALNENPAILRDYFQLNDDFEFQSSWNIAPSFPVCVITADDEGGRNLRKMRWGLIPSWVKGDSMGSILNNARGETLAEKPSFRSAFKYRRCIIPASGFYEWKTLNRIKHPWYINLKSREPLPFAGLWETWQSPEGDKVESCCIITTTANSIMDPIHDRMPVILNPGQWDDWLSPNIRQTDNLLPLIRPYSAGAMQAWPVTRQVNKVGVRNDAGLIEPISS
jgi:putative SOS response-associated peptidase YedK